MVFDIPIEVVEKEMKMGRKFVIALMVIGCLAMPGIARAAFFDGGPWYMDFDDWWVEVIDEEGDAVGQTDLYDGGGDNRLHWTTGVGWTDHSIGDRSFASKWTFPLNQDFEFSVDYYYDHEGSSDNDEAGIELSLYYMEGGPAPGEEPDVLFSLGAVNQYNGSDNRNIYSSVYETSNP